MEKNGGRPKKETSGFKKEKTNGFENTKTKTKPNENVNVNVNDNENVNANVNENDLYLTLFNKYIKRIRENPNRTIQIISELQNSSDYELLTIEEQEQIYIDLMNPQKRR